MKSRKPKATGPAEPAFEYVFLTPDRAKIVCKLDSGGPYELPVSAFERCEEWDGGPAVAVRIDKYPAVAWLKLRSGKELDFPSDFVLHHCDRAYAFHATKVKPSRVGARIRQVREEKGLSLGQVAARSGIAKPNLSRLEHDKVDPSIGTLRKVAAALGVQAALLLQA